VASRPLTGAAGIFGAPGTPPAGSRVASTRIGDGAGQNLVTPPGSCFFSAQSK